MVKSFWAQSPVSRHQWVWLLQTAVLHSSQFSKSIWKSFPDIAQEWLLFEHTGYKTGTQWTIPFLSPLSLVDLFHVNYLGCLGESEQPVVTFLPGLWFLGVFISEGCHNTLLQTAWFKTTETHCFRVLETRSMTRWGQTSSKASWRGSAVSTSSPRCSRRCSLVCGSIAHISACVFPRRSSLCVSRSKCLSSSKDTSHMGL